MSDKPTKSDKSPKQRPMPKPEITLTFYEYQSAGERMWNALKADIRFCALAIKQEYVESRWYKIMRTIRKVNRFLEITLSVGLLFSAGYLYVVYAYPYLGVLGTVIITLSALVVVLGIAVRATRLFHERTIEGLKAAHQAEQDELEANVRGYAGLFNAISNHSALKVQRFEQD